MVEDNDSIAKGLKYTLRSGGYEVEICGSCESALKQAAEEYSLMIIDITLPDGNGFELYEDMKKYNTAPVIFLTAKDDEDSIVKGFDLGAEDYITKPFSARELMARINRILKKTEKTDNIIHIEDIVIDRDSKTVTRSGEKIEFTALEYRIFLMLAQNKNKTVTRESILEKIWDLAGNYVNDNTLTVYIKRIRKKLGCNIIKTVKGIGYYI